MRYEDFVAGKLQRVPPTGLSEVPRLHRSLFPHQRDIVAWALRRGRAAIFADTGLGKTAMQLEWAHHVDVATSGSVLILAPLAVAAQTAREGERLGIDVTVCRDGADVRDGINITNYDRMHRFDPRSFAGVVLDESSIIKHHNAKTLRALLDAFRDTPFRLACTATPAPNDFTELGTHAEFLGVCSRAEMLAEFFVHDGGSTQDWRIKGHARAPFWRWAASWAALLRRPSDLGYDDAAYELPPLRVHTTIVSGDISEAREQGLLFVREAASLSERRSARRASISKRVAACAETIAREHAHEQWIVWCELNDEASALADVIPGAVEIRGSHTAEEKEQAIIDFVDGKTRVLVSKPSIFGFGLNLQRCARMAFVGVSDSWESYYQAVRRCWRFGQTRQVHVHLFASEAESAVVANLARKEEDAKRMGEELAAETRAIVREEVRGQSRTTNAYAPAKTMRVPEWVTSEEESAA